jgi:hypothetical protein
VTSCCVPSRQLEASAAPGIWSNAGSCGDRGGSIRSPTSSCSSTSGPCPLHQPDQRDCQPADLPGGHKGQRQGHAEHGPRETHAAAAVAARRQVLLLHRQLVCVHTPAAGLQTPAAWWGPVGPAACRWGGVGWLGGRGVRGLTSLAGLVHVPEEACIMHAGAKAGTGNCCSCW